MDTTVNSLKFHMDALAQELQESMRLHKAFVAETDIQKANSILKEFLSELSTKRNLESSVRVVQVESYKLLRVNHAQRKLKHSLVLHWSDQTQEVFKAKSAKWRIAKKQLRLKFERVTDPNLLQVRLDLKSSPPVPYVTQLFHLKDQHEYQE